MSPKPITENTLFYGDNLPILREYVPDESVDLIYLDPPFNSNRSYNVLFRDETGHDSESQIVAFDDTWHWGDSAEETYHELVTEAAPNVGKMIAALRDFIGTNQMMAYLVMMAARLVELHRVLKPTGSLYLHCDPTASHYLKIVLDTIMGAENFRNEIAWKRTAAHSAAKGWGPVHDVILTFSKSSAYTWNRIYQSYSDEYVERYKAQDEGGVYTTDNLTGPGTRSGSSGEPWRGYDVRAKGAHWKVNREVLESLVGAEKAGLNDNPGKARRTGCAQLHLLDKGKWPSPVQALSRERSPGARRSNRYSAYQFSGR